MKINSLHAFRYSITGMANGSVQLLPLLQASQTVTMSTTYLQLIHEHTTRIQRETISASGEQITRNHLTALRGFLNSIGKSESSPIGEEMGATYAEEVKLYLAKTQISERSKSDRRSLLNAWRLTFDFMAATPRPTVLRRERPTAVAPPHMTTPFEKGLKSALRIAGLSPKGAARAAGISISALGRWCRGALPNLRSNESLRKLETVLNLPAGRLDLLLQESLGKQISVHRNTYRERLRSRCEDTYHLKFNELTEAFLDEWNGLIKHKTDIRAHDKQRYGNGRWSEGGAQMSYGSAPLLSTLDKKHYASAGILWIHVGGFLGFLKRPREKSGWGIHADYTQTLAWLAVPEAIEAYLVFLTERSGGLRHTGHSVFCSSVAALMHPIHGYLLQSPYLLHQLPAEFVKARNWVQLCETSRSTALEWKSICTDISRDPALPIQFLLDQTTPFEPVMLAMQKLRVMGDNAPAKSKDEARARRDELLLGLLLSNPLRRKNLIELTVRDDNSGSVYKSATGNWRIRLARSSFKNGKRGKMGGSKNRQYDVAVAPWLNSLLTDYVQHFRPTLASKQGIDNLFLSAKGTPLQSMTSLVISLTRVLIPGSGGFGPHAFRHLVATDWLRRNPNDFLTVAELLNDTLQVVMSTYAHLKQDDALTRHSNQLNDILPAYMKLP